MQQKRTLLVGVAFVFYVFAFPDLETAIAGLSPSLPLYNLLRIVPYIFVAVFVGFLAHFATSKEEGD